MSKRLIAIVGDITSGRTLDPPLLDAGKAKRAAEELGKELARQGVHIIGNPIGEG